MRLALLGAGKMGEALARGMLRVGLVAPADLTLADIDAARVKALATELGVAAASSNADAVAGAALAIIAVKPPDVAAVCREIAPALSPGSAVLSIAAGITMKQLAATLDRGDLVLARAMPNTPCLVGAGAIGLNVAAGAPVAVRERLVALLSAVGIVEEVSEPLLDAVTGLSGSGPAYIAILIEALADGGVLAGLPRVKAHRLAVQTVLGTAKLLQETGQQPSQVKDAVSSPGGTTIAGIAVLEEAGFRHSLIAAVQAAARRARELSGE